MLTDFSPLCLSSAWVKTCQPMWMQSRPLPFFQNWTMLLLRILYVLSLLLYLCFEGAVAEGTSLAITVYFVNHYSLVFYYKEEDEVAGTSNQHLYLFVRVDANNELSSLLPSRLRLLTYHFYDCYTTVHSLSYCS